MGLFCIETSKDPVDLINCAIGNCKIWMDYAIIPRSYTRRDGFDRIMTLEEQHRSMSYVLDIALGQVDEALHKICKREYTPMYDQSGEEHF